MDLVKSIERNHNPKALETEIDWNFDIPITVYFISYSFI